jgi:hypothetical protein
MPANITTAGTWNLLENFATATYLLSGVKPLGSTIRDVARGGYDATQR